MATSAPPPAKLKTRTEFSVTLEVPPAASPSSWYRFEFKEAGSSWDDSVQCVDAAPGAADVVLDDLNPTSTYEVRLYAVCKDAAGQEQLSPPSEVAAVDTEVPGCGPESQGCVCALQ